MFLYITIAMSAKMQVIDVNLLPLAITEVVIAQFSAGLIFTMAVPIMSTSIEVALDIELTVPKQFTTAEIQAE